MAQSGIPIDEQTKKRIAELAAEGLKNADICRELKVSKNTVKRYSAGVFVPPEKKQQTHQEKGESCVRGNNKNCIDGVIFFRDDIVERMAEDQFKDELEEKRLTGAIYLIAKEIVKKFPRDRVDKKREDTQAYLHEFGDGQRRKGDVVRIY